MSTHTPTPKDWRNDYIICPHVERNTPEFDLRHQGFRVCCVKCANAGFLIQPYLEIVSHDRDGLYIAKARAALAKATNTTREE